MRPASAQYAFGLYSSLFHPLRAARTTALVLFFCWLPGPLQAQTYPMPGSKSENAVLCTGCAGVNAAGVSNDGLPTYPYAPPLMDFVGRYVDSQMTANYQHIGFRTARARFIRAYPTANGQAPPRLYIQIGNAIGAYSLDTFFSQKLPAGPVSVGGVKTGSSVGGFGRTPLEKITMWDSFMYPEATASGWFAPLIDQQDPIADNAPFDVDDRGYLYGSWPSFGWGIARDDGRTSGVHFPKVVQLVPNAASVDQAKYPNTRTDSSGVSAQSILVIRDGAKYYAVIASVDARAVFDVTDPATPALIGTASGAAKGMKRYARSDAFGRVAYIDGSGVLQVYSYASLISNGSAVLTAVSSVRGGFTGVTFDETGNIWAVNSGKVVQFTVAGSSYLATEYTPFPDLDGITALTVGGGHLAVTGVDRSGASPVYDVRLAKLEVSGPRQVDLDGFFRKYYYGVLPDYAQPGQYTFPFDIELVTWGGKTYLMYSASGLGDVYELNLGDPPWPCDPPTAAVASISGATATCTTGSGGTASVAVTGGGAVTYQWGWRADNSGPIQAISGANARDYQLSGADLGAAGVKELVVTVSSWCGAPLVSNPVPVEVLPATLTINASSGVFASSTENTATVADVGAASFSWTVTNGTIESGQGTRTIRYTAGASGDVELSVNVTTSSCTWTGATTVPTIVRAAGASMLYLVTPCRISDTRDSTPIASGSTRTLTAGGLCGIPSDAKSIAANVTVVAPATGGWLALHAAEAAWGGTSTLNYRAGRTRANSAVVPLSVSGQLMVRNEGTLVHVIVDVTGYFR